MAKCCFPPGVVVKPDGVHELESPCVYQTIERWANVTVEVRRCKNCGDVEVVWFRQDDTYDAMEDLDDD